MIILEGTDKSGKTTLMRNLIKHFPEAKKQQLEFAHYGLLPSNWDYCEDYCKYVKPNMILDRFMDSERVYGPVYRKSVNPRLTEENMLKVYNACSRVGTLVIYCSPDIDIAMARVDAEGDLLVKKREHLEKLREKFEEIYNSKEYPLDVEIIDTSYELKESTFKALIHKALMLENKANQINRLNYRGHISPSSKYLIYSSLPLETIQYLIYKMNKKLLTKEFGFVYSKDIENNPVNIHSLQNISNCKKVFVLGKDAMESYKQADNKTGSLSCQTIYEFIKLIGNV